MTAIVGALRVRAIAIVASLSPKRLRFSGLSDALYSPYWHPHEQGALSLKPAHLPVSTWPEGATAMLTRHAIDSGAYLKHFESIPDLLPLDQIEASLEATMRLQPPDTDAVWVFAYGSLIWNPMVEFECRRIATLQDWHRSFCLRMTTGRGNAEYPGRMLALEPGGTTLGMAMKLSGTGLYDELRRIWIREMVLGSYRPIWAVTVLDDGTERPAIAFVADTARDQFQPDSSVETVAPLIGSASGAFGSNAEYLFLLRAALARYGLHDPYVDAIAARLECPSTNPRSLSGSPD